MGLLYSTIGLTLGSVVAFAVGRWLGARYVRKLVSPDIWHKMGFIVEAEGAILCFIVFLMPGLLKDVTCYLFGLRPMPFWVFAVASTLGRIPSTWVLSGKALGQRRVTTFRWTARAWGDRARSTADQPRSGQCPARPSSLTRMAPGRALQAREGAGDSSHGAPPEWCPSITSGA